MNLLIYMTPWFKLASSELGDSVPSNYIYPATELTQVFKDRRQQMMQLQR